MNDSPPIISLQDVELTYRVRKQFLSKQKRQVNALRNITFDIFRGEKLGIIGRNGCGKSTLFKILAGIFEPDGGEFSAEPGLNVQLLSLGVGFEGNLTGRENAILNGMLLGKSRNYMRERADAIREFSELGEFFEMPVYTYSSGMNARLGFSVALEANPDVLLIDEVLGVGDAHFAEKSEKAMIERFDSHATIVLVTHNHQMIQRLCDRAVWVEAGQTRMVGNTDEVTEAYLRSLELSSPGRTRSEPSQPKSAPAPKGPSASEPPGTDGAMFPGEAVEGGFCSISSLWIESCFKKEWTAVNIWDCRDERWILSEHRTVFDLSGIKVENLPGDRWFGVSVWSFTRQRWFGVYVCLRGGENRSDSDISLVTQTSGGNSSLSDGIGPSVDIALETEDLSGKGWFSARRWSTERNSWVGGEEPVFEPPQAVFVGLDVVRWHWVGLWSFHESGWFGGSWVGVFPYEE